MSAAAFISFPDRFVMISDGVTYTMEEKPHLISETARKVWKIRPSTGLMWIGARPNGIDQIVQSVTGLDAKSAIFRIAAILRAWLAKDPETLAIMDNKRPYGVFIFECFNDYTEQYRLAYHVDRFTPYYVGKIKTGAAGALLATSAPHFGPYVEKYYSPDKPPEDVALKAFTDMVNEYKAEGSPVGGEIFTEVLKPTKNRSYQDINEKEIRR